jgi:SSS family solute:Na+ symporter
VLIAQFIALASIVSVLLDVSYTGSLLAISLVVVSYTLLGGMLGVIRADGVQFIILLVGLLVAVPLALSAAGAGDVKDGWQKISQLPDIFAWTTPGLPWFAVLGQLVWLFAIPVQPHLVSRFLSARTEKDIVISLPICVSLTLFIYTATIPLGLAGRILEPDLDPGAYYYVVLAVNHFPVLIGALALAGIASAALSTCSTVLLIAGQTVSRQVLQRLPMPGWFTPMYGARAGVLIIGVGTWLIAAIQPLGIFWLVVLSASLLASGFFVPLFLGMLWRRASAEGAVAAMLVGTISAVTVYLVNGQFGTQLFISEVFAGLVMSLIIMVVISIKAPASEQEMAVVDCARKLPS